MSEKERLAELERGLRLRTGVKDVSIKLILSGLNADDSVILHYLFTVRLSPGLDREAVKVKLRRFFFDKVRQSGLNNALIEIDERELFIFDPPI